MNNKIPSWCIDLELPQPSLKDNTGDWDRLNRTILKKFGINRCLTDISLIRRLPSLLREENFSIKCSLFRDRCGFYITGVKGKEEKNFLGVAIDLGTTRYVINILDLEEKKVLCEGNYLNPQAKIGPDILSRIHYAETKKGLEELKRLIREDLNKNIHMLCESKDCLLRI